MKIAGPDPFNGIPCGLRIFNSAQFMFVGRRTVEVRRLLILIEQARPNFVAGKIGIVEVTETVSKLQQYSECPRGTQCRCRIKPKVKPMVYLRTHKANVQSKKNNEGVPRPSQLKCCVPSIPTGT